MQNLKTQNKPKNLRAGCHFYNEKMEFDVYKTVKPLTITPSNTSFP